MADLLQQDDARGEELVSGAKDREVTRQTEANGEQTGGGTLGQNPIDGLNNKSTSSPKPGLGSRLGGAAKGAAKFIGKNKKVAGIGGGGVGIILTIVLSFSGFLSLFEAVHVAENLKNDVMKKLGHMEEKASAKVLASILSRAHLPVNAVPSDHPNPVRENIAATNTDGFVEDLKNNGITQTTAPDGRVTLTGGDGKAIELKSRAVIDSHPGLFSETTAAIPIKAVEIRADYEPLLHYQDGAGFAPFTGDEKQKIKEDIDREVRQGEKGKLGQDTSKLSPDEASAANSTNDAVKAADEEYTATHDTEKAAKQGIKAMFKGSFKTIEVLLATAGCMVQQIVHDNAVGSYTKKSKELMRLSNVLFSVGDQSKNGQKMSMGAYGTFVSSELNGNYKSNNAENRKGFDQSAAWRQTTGQPVTAANPAINAAADPNQDAGLSGIIGSVVNNSLVNAGCIVLLSPIGNAAATVLGAAAHAVVAVFTVGGSSLAEVGTEFIKISAQNYAAGIAIDEAAQHSSRVRGLFDKLSTLVLAGADLTITGNDNAVQFLNNAKLGGDMSANSSARSLGGHRLSKKDSLKLVATANHEQAIAMAKTSVWNRTFSLANVDSIASRLLIRMPFTKEQAIADMVQLTNTPKILLSDIKLIFFPVATADGAANFSNSQQFGFTDEEIARYPVESNSDYMTDPNQGVSVPLTEFTSVMVPRSYILGEPSTNDFSKTTAELPTCTGQSDDNGTTIQVGSCGATGTYGGARTNFNDFLGCYVNAVKDPSEARQTVCGDMLDFKQTDNPSLISDNLFLSIYCNDVPPIKTNVCHVPSGVDHEMLRYGIYLLDYHISKSLKEYADAKTGKFYDSSAAGINGATAPTGTPTAASGSGAQLAAQVLAKTNIVALLPGVTSDLKAVAAGQTINNADSCGNAVTIDPGLLQVLLTASTKYKIELNNIITGHSCNAARHPRGYATDFNKATDLSSGASTNFVNGSSGDNQSVDRAFIIYIASIFPNRGGIGQSQCAGRSGAPMPPNVDFYTDDCTHQHIDTRGP